MKRLALAAALALGSTAASAACFTYGNLYRCENPDFSQSYGERYGNMQRQWGPPPGGTSRRRSDTTPMRATRRRRSRQWQ